MLSSMSATVSAAAVTKLFFKYLRNYLELYGNTKIYHNVALVSLYISTSNDVIIYFQSAAIRIIVFNLGNVRVAIFLDNGSFDFTSRF